MAAPRPVLLPLGATPPTGTGVPQACRREDLGRETERGSSPASLQPLSRWGCPGLARRSLPLLQGAAPCMVETPLGNAGWNLEASSGHVLWVGRLYLFTREADLLCGLGLDCEWG